MRQPARACLHVWQAAHAQSTLLKLKLELKPTCMCAGRQTTLGSSWSNCLIPPEQLEICKRYSSNCKLPAQDWKLGSGAFGTVTRQQLSLLC